ncbi:MAG: tyrosine transporter [Parachlamydiaceae bacterium]|nr:tyrosine transporter [Parachlamydiaceae bacterium]
MNNDHQGTILKGALLVAGTSIGGGMLALPVLTSLGGFLPSIVVYLFCWMFMTATGLLFVELALSMDKGVNLISMSQRTLGWGGKALSWILYLGLFYCLSVAYIVGCANLLSQLLNYQIPDWVSPFLVILMFMPFVFVGTHLVGRLNIFLMAGLIISFVAFLILGTPFVKKELLAYQDWSKSLLALPIAFASFAYQGIVPTLVEYMGHEARRIRIAVCLGTTATFITYIIWQWLIQGIVPTFAPGGLAETLENGQNAVQPLKNFIDAPAVYVVGQSFAFFALVTSFFGVALGLLDFLADGLTIKKTTLGKLFLCALVFIPPLIIALTHPHVFLSALGYAGGYGCALLLGLFPIVMAWVARYRSDLHPPRLLPGGKLLLIIMMLFVVCELILEIRGTLSKF